MTIEYGITCRGCHVAWSGPGMVPSPINDDPGAHRKAERDVPYPEPDPRPGETAEGATGVHTRGWG